MLTIIDGYGYIFRAYYGLPPLTDPHGEPVGAIYGFCRMILNLIETNKTDYFVVALDTGKKTKRSEIYTEYKAHRPEVPDDLKKQLPIIRELCAALGLPAVEVAGYEADDVIATYAEHAVKAGIPVKIFSGDKDLIQLMQKNVSLFDPIKNKEIDNVAVMEKYGVLPEKIIEVQALIGDTADNIPGVPGIGPKTAKDLITEYGSLEELYAKIDTMKPSKRKETLIAHKNDAFLSKQLITLSKDVPLPQPVDTLKIKTEPQKAMQFLQRLGFLTLMKKFDTPHETIPLSPFLKHCEKALDIAFFQDEVYTPTYLYKGADAIPHMDAIFHNPGISKIFEDLKRDALSAHAGISTGLHDFGALYICRHLGKPRKKIESAVELYEQFKNLYDDPETCLNLYYQIDFQMPYVLKEMEDNGVKIDIDYLTNLKTVYEKKIEETQKKIYDYTGVNFNIDSPKQLGHILFEKSNLPSFAKTKSGQASTDIETLEKLAELGYELPFMIIEYRGYTKMLSTYIDPLLQKNKDGYVHTTFSHTATVTGRLASSNPNLQNIPVRNKDIRKAFIASSPDHVIMSFDYSQIELRLLAHYAKEEELIKAFQEDKDIHTITAQNLFHITDVTDEMRRKAKIVNFGIIYGMSVHGLSEAMEISREEAKNIIETYFSRYPGIKKYIEDQIEQAKTKGYVQTILNRPIYIADIHSKIFQKQQFAQRQATNAPLQGSNAEIIKLAMIQLSKWFGTQEIKRSRMILQIHDELLFDVHKSDVALVKKEVLKIMESVTSLIVPLKVNVGQGDNWFEAH